MLITKAVGDGKATAVSALTGWANGPSSPIPIIIAASRFLIVRFIARFIDISILLARPHFRMTRTHFRLALALIVSLLLHLIPFIRELIAPTPAPLPPPPALTAELRAPPPASQPQLMLPEPPPLKADRPAPARPAIKPERPSGKNAGWQEAVRKQFRQQDERGLFYPAEAIAQGIEGEVLVLLILDEAGHAVAARVEQGSGHPSLDQAALRAARALRSLPADAPRETLIPVRFRLR